MFSVKFKNGKTIPATSIEESYRPEHDGKTHISLIIQNSNANGINLDSLKSELTEDALSKIQVYGENKSLLITYTGYKYIRYLTIRLQPGGAALLDANFVKENLS